ncbi:MarR family winged helix-turn-helix transcriptional regulator [Dactylosporangium sp. NPDC000244]|uniref:MarR family winged helix-turn-helix transcriptional regulator n=1 Tax=Dactylosporangium sp. NPDC000244 TaxID=3154365 RepID=UPI003316B074
MILDLQRAAHAVLIRLATELDGLSMLSPFELNALGNLAAAGSATTPSALGAAIGCRPAAVPSILERLEMRGLVTREAGTGEHEELVALTADGVAAAAEVSAAMRELERRAFAGLSTDATGQATAALRALTEAATLGTAR